MTTLTRDAVLSLPAGEELDALVAEHVMGIVPCDAWAYAGWDHGYPSHTLFKDACKHAGNCYPAPVIRLQVAQRTCRTDRLIAHIETYTVVSDTPLPGGRPDAYSTSMLSAWRVVEHMRPAYDVAVFVRSHEVQAYVNPPAAQTSNVGTAAEAPLAICRAVLLQALARMAPAHVCLTCGQGFSEGERAAFMLHGQVHHG